jgi:micrococcal nuclease
MRTAIFAFAFSVPASLMLLSGSGLALDPVAVLTGKAGVKDGDGILFGKVEVRLQGIAAPEYNGKKKEPGGFESLNSLRRIVRDKRLVCHLDGTTAGPDHRPVGICYLEGEDLGAYQVKNGHARDCPRYSQGRYADLEKLAQAAGKNLSTIYRLPKYCKKSRSDQ